MKIPYLFQTLDFPKGPSRKELLKLFCKNHNIWTANIDAGKWIAGWSGKVGEHEGLPFVGETERDAVQKLCERNRISFNL